MTDPRARLAELLALMATPDAFFIPNHRYFDEEILPNGKRVLNIRGVGYNERVSELWQALEALGWVGPDDEARRAAIPKWPDQLAWLAATDVAGLRCWLWVITGRERIVEGLWGSALREGHFALVVGRLLREA